MCRRLAPSARRMPISRVRSVTVASMMFMIPIPPTTSEKLAMPTMMKLNMRLSRSALRRIWIGALTSTSTFSPWPILTMFSATVASRSTSSVAVGLEPDLGQLDLLALERAGLLRMIESPKTLWASVSGK